jgi:hypothetical protein
MMIVSRSSVFFGEENEMRKISKLCSILLLLNLILVACSPSQEELDATETKVAADDFATQTANAPTSTATFTASPEPTSTYTPEPSSTPTSPPSPADDSASSGDFIEYSTSGFHITLPAQWEVVDINQEGVEALWEVIEGLETEWAEAAQAMYSSEAMLEAFDLWAIDSAPTNFGFAVAAVMSQEFPYPIAAKDLCTLMPSTYEQMGIEMVDSDCSLEINGINTARFIVRIEVEGMVMKQVQYCYLSGTDMWVLTMGVVETEWMEYEPVLFGIAESFRID